MKSTSPCNETSIRLKTTLHEMSLVGDHGGTRTTVSNDAIMQGSSVVASSRMDARSMYDSSTPSVVEEVSPVIEKVHRRWMKCEASLPFNAPVVVNRALLSHYTSTCVNKHVKSWSTQILPRNRQHGCDSGV